MEKKPVPRKKNSELKDNKNHRLSKNNTLKDKEAITNDMEMDDFFKELEEKSDMKNISFQTKNFEVKKMIRIEQIKEKNLKEISQNYNSNISRGSLRKKPVLERDENDILKQNNYNQISNTKDKNETDNNKNNNFLSNILGGKRASMQKNEEIKNKLPSLLETINKGGVNNKSKKQEKTNKTSEKIIKIQAEKIEHIKLSPSNDMNLKAFDNMFTKVDTLQELENIKAKIFNTIKSSKNTVEIGDLLFRLGRKFNEIIDEDDIRINQNIIECFSKSVKIYQKIPEEDLRIAEVYKNLSIIYLKRKYRPEVAIKVLNNAIKIFIEKVGEYSFDYAECLINLGYIYDTSKLYEESKNEFQNSFDTYCNIFKKSSQENSNNLNASNINNNNNNDEILIKHDMHEIKISKCLIKKEIADSYFRIANSFENLKKFNEAIEFYKNSFIVYNLVFESEDNKFCKNSIMNIGMIYYNLKQMDQAVKFLKKCSEIEHNMEIQNHMETGESLKDPKILDTSITIARIYFDINSLENCLNLIEKIIWEILLSIEKNSNENISERLGYDLMTFKYIENPEEDNETNKNNNNNKLTLYNFDENKHKLIKAFLTNFKELEFIDEITEYQKEIFDINEILSDIFVRIESINFLILSVRNYIVTCPPAEFLVEKCYIFLMKIINNMDKEEIYNDRVDDFDDILEEFLKFFDAECSQEQLDFEKDKIDYKNIVDFELNNPNNNTMINNNNFSNELENSNNNLNTNILKTNTMVNNNNNQIKPLDLSNINMNESIIHANTMNPKSNISVLGNNNNNPDASIIGGMGLNQSQLFLQEKSEEISPENQSISDLIRQKNSLAKKISKKYSDFLINIGSFCSSYGFVPKSIEYFKKAIILTSKILNFEAIKKLADLYNNLGIEYDVLNIHHLSVLNFGRSFRIKCDISGNKSITVARTHFNMGVIYDKLDDYNEAISNWLRCIKIRELPEHDDKLGVAHCYYNIGVTQMKIKSYTLAIDSFKKLEDIFSKQKQNINLNYLFSLYSLGECYFILKKIDEALISFGKLEKRILNIETEGIIFQEGEGSEDIGQLRIKSNLLFGICLSTTKNHNEAIERLENSLDALAENEEERNYYTVGLYELAKCYEITCQYEKAKIFYERTVELTKDIWSPTELVKLNKKKEDMVNFFIEKFLNLYFYLIIF